MQLALKACNVHGHLSTQAGRTFLVPTGRPPLPYRSHARKRLNRREFAAALPFQLSGMRSAPILPAIFFLFS